MANPISALNGFATSIRGLDARETLKLDQDAKVARNGTLSHFSTNLVRSAATQAQNNAVRRALLKQLGRTFGLNEGNDVLMYEYADGRVDFHPEFMDRLRDILGDQVLKSSDFGFDKDGNVTSGKPLTARRVKAIVEAASNIVLRERRLKMATDIVSERIERLLESLGPGKGRRQELSETFGNGPWEIRANVRKALKASPYFMDIAGVEQPDEAFFANMQKLLKHNVGFQFKDKLQTKLHNSHGVPETENCGFYWEMLRCGTGGDRRWRNVTVNGQSLKAGNLGQGVPGFAEAEQTLKNHPAWDENDRPDCNEATMLFSTTLKALIPDTGVLKCVTTQLGLQGGPTSLGQDVPEDIPLKIGGHNLGKIAEETLVNPHVGIGCMGFSDDGCMDGEVDIKVEPGKVTITQKFHIGLSVQTLAGRMLTGGGDLRDCPLLPLWNATSTVTIRTDQHLPFGQIPEFTTDLKLENA